jgi:hypothetical protein
VVFEGPDYEGPLGTVRAYYNAINICVYETSFKAPYDYLGKAFQAAQPYNEFAAGFADTTGVTIEEMTLLEEEPEYAVATVIITAMDLVDGMEEETRYDITWALTQEDGTWKLDQAQVSPLNQ